MNKTSYILFFQLVLFSCLNQNFAQEIFLTDSVTVIPGLHYSLNQVSKIFLGEHWRKLWTTPVKVEVLNLKEFEGGLTPLKEGGGKQTKSLHLIDASGKRWKFRSIDKDPEKVLPDYLRESIAEDVLQDQISSANPYAPLILPKLLEAVNITQAAPKLVLMPDDSSLGIYKNKFAGVLGFIESHTDEAFIDDIDIQGAVDVEDTFDAIKEIEKNTNQKFSAEEYLKVKLIDILVGDWDRHMDQWRWIKVEDSIGVKWRPIPRDRDQAFVKFDGVLPAIAAYYTPQLNNFGNDYPSIKDLTWNGRFLDSRVLTEMDKTTWDSLTLFVYSNITDSLIEETIKTLPSEVYNIAKDEIDIKLKNRRDKLEEASNEFYNVVNKYADIFCSRQGDYVEVKRIDDKSISVSVYNRNESSNQTETKPYFYKVFDNDITTEIRIYLNDGDDKAIVSDIVENSPVVRIIGGEGKDELNDESIVNGYFFSITPFRSAENKTYFYDSGKKTIIVYEDGTIFDDTKFVESDDVVEKYQPTPVDKGHLLFPLPILGYDSDRGLTVGASVQLIKYGFRQIPFENQQTLAVSYSTGFKKFTITYDADFYGISRYSYLNLLLSGTEHFTTRYFGYGNETIFDEALEDIDFYEVNQNLITFSPTFHYNFSDYISTSLGLSFIYSKTSLNNNVLLSEAKFGEFGLGKLNPLGFNLGFEFSDLDDNHYFANGYRVKISGSFFPSVFNIPRSFSLVDVDLKAYFSPKILSGLTLAVRAGGKKVWGRYPFFASASLGASENLRGYYEKRFSGDASLFGQTELRMFLTDMNLILKSKLGLSLFAETGRVFISDQSSDVWHPSYGLGLWISYLDARLIFSSYVAFSPETTLFSVGTGYAF